jgi:hypothetical protein
MSESDVVWQERITKVVKRVAKDLLVNDEAEIGEVVRRRLFDDLGRDSLRRSVALTYANWCFDHRAELLPEVTAVDRAVTEASARDFLRARFEQSYPFHPATLTVFQRKWRSLTQFQQTRGTLAMFAQWISIAFSKDHKEARREALLTLGSAPLHVREFRSVVLGQLGEVRLDPALDSDIAGIQNKAAALDADVTKGPLKDIHRRVGATILFESSGGQSDQTAHQPELRFALGEPEVDTTSIDNAASALEGRSFYIRKAGTDGYRFGLKPKLEKVVYDRRASLDDAEIKKATEKLVEGQFRTGATLYLQRTFPKDSADVEDIPQLNLVAFDPDEPWAEEAEIRSKLVQWTKNRAKSARLYPASIIWCLRKPGRELRDRVEGWLAWQRVQKEIGDRTLGGEFETSELKDVAQKVRAADDDARDEVWASYRFIAFADPKCPDGLRCVDLGAGHSSGARSLCDRVLGALKSNALLNESPGAGYLERRWPEAFKASGAWPIKSLRQAFLDGSLERLINPDEYLKRKVPEFIASGDFGLASGDQPGGGYQRIWFSEPMSADEVSFDPDVYLLKKERAKALRAGNSVEELPSEPSVSKGEKIAPPVEKEPIEDAPRARNIVLSGAIPPELWNKVGIRLIPKLRSNAQPTLGINFVVEVESGQATNMVREIEQALVDLALQEKVTVKFLP